MKYKSIIIRRRGGPEVLEVTENDLRDPAAVEVRVRVLATAVGGSDINYRHGYSPFSPRPPFTPGYEIMGIVDAIGSEVKRVKAGDRVAALTAGHDGYSEMVYIGQEHLLPVPASLDPADVVVLVLNYATAYQILKRVAKIKPGDKALVIGASGGVGTALLDLGRLYGLKLYGTASASKHAALAALGATPIDYKSQDYVAVIQASEPGGLDFVFDGQGGKHGTRGLSLLKRGGKLVEYASPTGLGSMLSGALWLAWVNLLPNGKRAEFFGITALYLRDKKPFMEDMPILLDLLAQGKIKPVISARLPLLEARKANELLEGGQVTGNIVLLAPELL